MFLEEIGEVEQTGCRGEEGEDAKDQGEGESEKMEEGHGPGRLNWTGWY